MVAERSLKPMGRIHYNLSFSSVIFALPFVIYTFQLLLAEIRLDKTHTTTHINAHMDCFGLLNTYH